MSQHTTPTSGAADLPEALRVPLDSLHADAGYLCGRLLNGSLTQEQVVESIRRRIDAAKLAALTAQAISKAPDHIAEVGDMVAQAISAEPAGAGYAELPDAKTLGEAVAAWIGVETRGAHKRVDTTVDRLGFAVRSVVGDMLRASNGQAPAEPVNTLH